MTFSAKSLILALATGAPSVLGAQSVSPSVSDAGVTAFVNVSVIPMDREQVLAEQTVLVRGRTIEALGPASQIAVPAGAVRVNGQGKFLMPGLGDMHVLLFPIEDETRAETWYAASRLFCDIANGVTTIRLTDKDTAFAELPKQIARGDVLGPRISLAGSFSLRRDSLPKYLPAIRAKGYDFVTIPENMAQNHELLDSIAAISRRAGMRVTGHIPSEIGLEYALKLPYASIQHLQGYLEYVTGADSKRTDPGQTAMDWDSLLTLARDPWRVDAAKIPLIAAATQKAGVWNVVMQSRTEQMLNLWSGTETASASSITAQTRRTLIKALADAGAGILVGTGAPAWGVDYGFGVHQELELLVASGLTPYQAIAAGTRNVATFLGTLDSAGTVAAGKRADLVLLNENPLANITNSTKIAGVMVNGTWLSKAKLDATLKRADCTGR